MPSNRLQQAREQQLQREIDAANQQPPTVSDTGNRVRQLGGNAFPVIANNLETGVGVGELVTNVDGRISGTPRSGNSDNVGALAQLNATIRRMLKIQRQQSVVLAPITIAAAEDAEYILFESEPNVTYRVLSVIVQDVTDGVASATDFAGYSLSHALNTDLPPSTKFVVTLSGTASERIFIQADFRARSS